MIPAGFPLYCQLPEELVNLLPGYGTPGALLKLERLPWIAYQVWKDRSIE